jgi:Rrf2 family iron-sulfur cluster assembly transcriptional regulator
MRLTTRSRCALVAITDVALHCSGGPVALSTVAARHGISLSYLETLFSALRRAGLVVSTRGPGGGYSLARSARDITVADISRASEQGKSERVPRDHDAMSAQQGAMTHELWRAFHQTVEDYLRSVTLADLVERHLATGCAVEEPPAAAPTPKRLAPPKRQLPRENVPNSVFALGAAIRTRS